MPATRTNIWALVHNPNAKGSNLGAPSTLDMNTAGLKTSPPVATKVIYPGRVEAGSDDIHYPLNVTERELFRTGTGKKLTQHQWAVYDHILGIPVGNVSTYKMVCDALGQGSPRSVGSALKNNPFAPYVPCHRVIASNLYLGGFCGEWGPESKTGTQFGRKLKILADEGVEFNSNGVLKSRDALWQSE